MKEQEKEKGTECGENKRQKSWRACFTEDERSRERKVGDSMQGRAKERGISEVQVETRGTKVGEHASQKMKDQGRERQK